MSCSSENAVIIVEDVYDEAVAALQRAGGYLAKAAEKDAIHRTLWVNGKLNRKVIAKDPGVFAAECGLDGGARAARFFMVEEAGVGPGYPFSDEKLAVVLTVYRARTFDDAVDKVRAIMEFKGKGHSVGIHTGEMAHARRLAEELDTARVLVNMAHTFGNGGGFDSGLNFTLSMGCGTWQGNSISENLNYRHFLNVTHLAVPIPEDRPGEEALFGAYWEKYGKYAALGSLPAVFFPDPVADALRPFRRGPRDTGAGSPWASRNTRRSLCSKQRASRSRGAAGMRGSFGVRTGAVTLIRRIGSAPSLSPVSAPSREAARRRHRARSCSRPVLFDAILHALLTAFLKPLLRPFGHPALP